jgi:hypothetical protein
MSDRRRYYIAMAEASEHEALASDAEAKACRLDPHADSEAKAKREQFYTGLAAGQRVRAEAWRELARRA